MPELLVAEGISKTYITPKRRLEVLKGCSLRLEAGRALSVLGASGSGKSTLLHILGTLDRPDSGRLAFRGQDLLRAKAAQLSEFRRRELGFIFQFHHLLPEFSALENVALPALIDHRPRREAFAKAQALLERVGLADRREHRPAELSGGEQQRVAVARALVSAPSLILADEPTGNLDAATGLQVANMLLDLIRDEATALILVTHDRELAARTHYRQDLEAGVLAPVEPLSG